MAGPSGTCLIFPSYFVRESRSAITWASTVDTWTIVCITGLAAGLTTLWLRERQRQSALRELAKRRGFTYIGQSLPLSLTLRGTKLQRATSVWNVIDGECGRTRVICFDCRVGSGRGSWRRTAIAVKASPDVFGTTFNPDLVVERSGELSIMYEPWRLSLIPPGLMPVSEIEAQLDAIR